MVKNALTRWILIIGLAAAVVFEFFKDKILILLIGIPLILAFDYAMDKDAKQMCDRGVGDEAVCNQAYGQ